MLFYHFSRMLAGVTAEKTGLDRCDVQQLIKHINIFNDCILFIFRILIN
ncbi:Uncharacterised protein [Yersinia frederiksenii]|jgi:hypothetical protein|uniref:Uncharacterized protein n=1 Tax=Yersinia frederiksenii TaxID=29484 RepID=A0AAI9EQU4_YERFR|nr:Uncharacterised protein [Yersinia frederiksenii]CNG64032.1 Uncharacterised protein [Yersinia frederiksenii]CNL97753.1 Uncharacterised protein [Yersinia frederiksenii]CQH59926.1 Uncharacterised protein [Yersinia frederiksenii]CQJ04131.1 Uncharacterised protein [Yersinia frederiksenii]